MQELVYASLEGLDRPYKRGEGVQGVTINRYEEVKDYGKVQEGMVPAREDLGTKVLREDMKNENRWIDNAVFELKATTSYTHH